MSDDARPAGGGSRGGECGRVFERLVEDPDAAAGDATLAAHLGSCLDCFRVLTELRDAARIADLLRRQALDEAAGDGASPPAAALDPGAAFWDRLTSRTVDAIAAAPAPTAMATPGPTRAAVRGFRRRPAVLVFAAAAVIVLGVLGGRLSRAPSPPVESAKTAPRSIDEVGGDGLDDTSATADVAALETPELQRLLEGLRRSEPDEVSTWFDADDDDAGFADQIAGLDAPALRRLARVLGGSTL
jgi:hypothetical protein